MRWRWFVVVALAGLGLSGTGAALTMADWAPAWQQPLAWSGLALAVVSIGGVACDMIRLQRDIRALQAQNEALAIQAGRWRGCPWLYQRDRRSWLLKLLGIATPKPSQRRWMAMTDAEREAYYQAFLARVEACRHQLAASRPDPPPSADPGGMTLDEFTAWLEQRRDRMNAAWLLESLEENADDR